MNEETAEKITEQPTLSDVMSELVKINRRLEGYDAQFEAIRQGIVDNQAKFDRIEGNFLPLRSSVIELTEEVRHNRKILV